MCEKSLYPVLYNVDSPAGKAELEENVYDHIRSSDHWTIKTIWPEWYIKYSLLFYWYFLSMTILCTWSNPCCGKIDLFIFYEASDQAQLAIWLHFTHVWISIHSHSYFRQDINYEWGCKVLPSSVKFLLSYWPTSLGRLGGHHFHTWCPYIHPSVRHKKQKHATTLPGVWWVTLKSHAW